MDAELTDVRELTELARERVQVGPPPGWITPCPYHTEFEPKIRGSITYLLTEHQVHAELHQSYVRSALRLEMMNSVQELSQWRIEFEPRTQSLVLHSLKIRRGAVETEHLALDRIQFLQRESGLQGLVIHGWITLLLIVEDVAPGDTLEWSYTLTNQPRLLAEFVHCFFTLPPGVEVGKYKFVVCHGEKRTLKWKSSQESLAPTIKSEGGEVYCSWFGDNFSSPVREDYTPSWQLDFPWIQISDCPDWQTVARAVQDAWKEEMPGDGLTKLIEEIKSFAPDSLSRINRAVELVQDGFRYLSVNLELGGQIPASAETVIRRRYGDCKDMAFLLVRLLQELGITARPVLVNALWRRSIARLLPSPGLFNHVVVEFEVENEKRWVDATLKLQGGGALGRSVLDFGVGLPIDAATSDLVPLPKASLPSGTLELKESFILDTAGNSSYLAIVVKAKGIYAETLRFEIANEGIEAVAKKRLQLCANRFSTAKRVGQLEYCDVRGINEFAVAEVFEIAGFLKTDRSGTVCVFSMQSDATAATLLRPSAIARRNPFVLPFPSNRVHTVEIIFAGLKPISLRKLESTNQFFSLSRRLHDRPGFISLTFSCSTKTDMVPPEMVKDHRKEVESAWQACSFILRLPRGYTRARKRSDFGALPSLTSAVPDKNSPSAQFPSRPAHVPQSAEELSTNTAREATLSPQTSVLPFMDSLELAAAEPAPSSSPSHHGRPRRHSGYSHDGTNNSKCWLSFFMLLGAMALLMVGISIGRSTAWWGFVGVISILVIPLVLGSVMLAGLGLRECVKQPGRYKYGRTTTILMLILGASFGWALTPMYVKGFKAATAGAKARHQDSINDPNLLKFDALGFVFHPPGTPWIQIDARKTHRNHALLMQRDKSIDFSIFVSKTPSGLADAREHLVEDLKTILRRDAISYKLITEGEVTHNRIAGWQMEVIANFQGHEQYYVDWLLATNGFGYHLEVWARVEFRSQVEQEVDRMFSGFDLTAPSPQ